MAREEKVVVVGSGLSGLALADSLRGVEVEVYEVRREPGGFFARDDYPVDGVRGSELVSRFLAGRKVRTGVAAFKLDEGGAWFLGEEGAFRAEGRVVLATGFRERTAVELGVYGCRPAGVFPLTAAWDFANMGYSVGDRVLIYGFNHYTLSLASRLVKVCDKVVILYREPSLVHSVDEALRLGVEVERGRVRRVEGRDRVELVKTDSSELRVDALVLGELAPWNPLGGRLLAGNAFMVIESPLKLVESSRLLAELLEAGGELRRVEGGVPAFPGYVSEKHRRVMLGVGRGARVRLGDRVVTTEEPYQVVELPPGKPRVEVA